MTTNAQHPCHHPILYVRGFAAIQGEIEETVADPRMGFNIGSTKTRMAWTGDVRRFYCESPPARLMSDHGYHDVCLDGEALVAHSMGGLVCRAFRQNPELGPAEARAAADKRLACATPHNGIDMRIVRNEARPWS